MTKDEKEAIKALIATHKWDLREKLLEHLRTLPDETKEPEEDRLTGSQFSALHLYCKHLSEALNDAGLTIQVVLAEAMEINWTPERVKELLWKKSQAQLFGTKSTKELKKTGQIDLIVDHINRYLGEKFELEHVPFPNEEGKNNIRLNAINNLSTPDYPEYVEPTI